MTKSKNIRFSLDCLLDWIQPTYITKIRSTVTECLHQHAFRDSSPIFFSHHLFTLMYEFLSSDEHKEECWYPDSL